MNTLLTAITAYTPAVYSHGDSADPNSAALGFLYLAIIITMYILPGIVASMRGHHNAAAIWCLDLLLGWTFIGWVVALTWGLTATKKATV